MQIKRNNWYAQIQDIPAEKLTFLDEAGVQTNMTRLRGRSLIGERLQATAPYGHWHTNTIISAIRLSGPCATILFDCPTDSAVFQAYVEQSLADVLQPGDVVIMDNLAAHKTPAVAQALARLPVRVIYLPPYSPDFNPIECMWSQVKAYIRAAEARTFPALLQALGEAIAKVTPDTCKAYFQNCKYAT